MSSVHSLFLRIFLELLKALELQAQESRNRKRGQFLCLPSRVWSQWLKWHPSLASYPFPSLLSLTLTGFSFLDKSSCHKSPPQSLLLGEADSSQVTHKLRSLAAASQLEGSSRTVLASSRCPRDEKTLLPTCKMLGPVGSVHATGLFSHHNPSFLCTNTICGFLLELF